MRRALAVGLFGVPVWLCLCAPPARAQAPAWQKYDDAARKAYGLGRFDEAARAFREGLNFAERMGLEGESVRSRIGLAITLGQTGRCAEAERTAKKALEDARRFDVPESPAAGDALFALAVVQSSQGKFVEAGHSFRQSLAVQERAYGGESLYVGQTLLCAGANSIHLGEYDDAKRDLKRSLAIMEKTEGPEHPHVAPVLTTLAEVELRLKRPAEADLLLARALAIREKAGGPPHPDQIATLTVLAETRLAQERTDEAEDLQKRALALCESLLGPDHPAVADARVRLAQISAHRNRFDDAEGQLKRALTSEERNWGPEHSRVVQLLRIYARVLRRAGRGAEAEPLEARIAAVRTKPADRHGPLAPNLLPFPDDPRPDPPPFGRVGLADLNRLWAEWGAKRVAPWLRLGPALAPASPAWTAAALASGAATRLVGVPAFDQEPVADKAPVDRRRMKHFRLPYTINENDRPRVGSIKLFVSCDQGENWRLVKEITPAEPAIQFSTAADGLHWFAVQVTDKDGRKAPNDLTDLEPAIAVVIEGNEVLPPR